MRTLGVVLVVALALAGCGPSVSRTVLSQGTPRAPDCELEFVQGNPGSIAFKMKWEVLGYVKLEGAEAESPASEINVQHVRPHLCEIGGTAMAIAMDSEAAGHGGTQSRDEFIYLALQKK